MQCIALAVASPSSRKEGLRPMGMSSDVEQVVISCLCLLRQSQPMSGLHGMHHGICFSQVNSVVSSTGLHKSGVLHTREIMCIHLFFFSTTMKP